VRAAFLSGKAFPESFPEPFKLVTEIPNSLNLTDIYMVHFLSTSSIYLYKKD